MHIQAAVEMVQTILLQVLIKQRVAIHLTIHAVVANDVRIQFQATGSSSIVLGIGAIAGSWITLTDVTHVHVLVHHATVGTVRRVHHIRRQQCALVQVCSCAWHSDRLLSG